MKTMSVGEFKAHFSEVLEDVKAGIGIAVTFGRKKEIISYFVPKSGKNKGKRKLGSLEGKAQVIFTEDFSMTDEELLGL
jgi:antitoxin (DNA-binding transcriptional repressor) of toxin-antitoxin stability system